MRWLGFVLTALLSLVAQAPIAPAAQAQVVGCSANGVPGEPAIPEYCDQGIAFSACTAAESAAAGRLRSRYPSQASAIQKYGCQTYGNNVYKCYVVIPGTAEDDCRVDGKVYSFFKLQNNCNTRNTKMPLADAAPWYNTPSTCVAGCKISGESFSQDNGGVKVYGMRNRQYTGDTCSGTSTGNDISPEPSPEQENKPKPDECVALGSGQTACVKPDGDHCSTASTGKTFCWKPGESGEKRDGPDAQTKEQKGKPVTPPKPPAPETEYQRKEGYQQTACMNNTCVTYNVTNFTETPKGSAKNGTGDNSPDGSKNTSGNGQVGSGSGGSGGDGKGDSASDSGNCETPPACTGDTLKCLHLRFTWKIQCNTKGSEISKGDGCAPEDVPICAGSSCKAEAYSQLLQQWRGRCNVEGLVKGVEGHAGQGDGDDGKGSIFIEDTGNGPRLDEGKLAYGSGQLGYSFDVQGIKFQIPQAVLDLIGVLRILIIAGAALAAIGIMRGNG